jgi:DNA-binding transcriptional regulator GbsR (MarR family)
MNRLADKVGTFIEYWGFKKIHGQMWTHLYLSPRPLSAQELISRLRISKALVSLSLKDLLHYGLIFQTDESLNKKNKFYQANPDVFGVIRNILVSREQELLRVTHAECGLLRDLTQGADLSSPVDKNRLESLNQMVEGAGHTLSAMIALTEIQPEQLKLMFDVK